MMFIFRSLLRLPVKYLVRWLFPYEVFFGGGYRSEFQKSRDRQERAGAAAGLLIDAMSNQGMNEAGFRIEKLVIDGEDRGSWSLLIQRHDDIRPGPVVDIDVNSPLEADLAERLQIYGATCSQVRITMSGQEAVAVARALGPINIKNPTSRPRMAQAVTQTGN